MNMKRKNKVRTPQRKKRAKPGPVYMVTHQVGVSVEAIDRRINALPPGKRISKNGKVYYETRRNRSDLKGLL